MKENYRVRISNGIPSISRKSTDSFKIHNVAIKHDGEWYYSCRASELPDVQLIIQRYETYDLSPQVLEFARTMEVVLQGKSLEKTGWERLSRVESFKLLIFEVVELMVSLGLNPHGITAFIDERLSTMKEEDLISNAIDESIDVANIAMMIYDNLSNGRG
jgi:hypothetical protein